MVFRAYGYIVKENLTSPQKPFLRLQSFSVLFLINVFSGGCDFIERERASRVYLLSISIMTKPTPKNPP